MPDWSYRTMFRPLFFCLPAVKARDLCLGSIGTLARLPFGSAVIDFLGHMRPPAELGRSYLGIQFPTAVGLGPGIDPKGAALAALARFGFGFLEIGPFTEEGLYVTAGVERRPDQEALWYANPPAKLGLEAAVRLAQLSRLGIPLIARLDSTPSDSLPQAAEACQRMMEHMRSYASLFALELPRTVAKGICPVEAWKQYVATLCEAARQAQIRPLLVCMPADLDAASIESIVPPALEAGAAGVIIDGSIRATPDGRLRGPPARTPALHLLGNLRERYGDRLFIIAGGGVHEPAQALEFLQAGANLVQVDSGLVYTGPGLPKRINDALLHASGRASTAKAAPAPPPEQSWFWTLLLGISMLLGGVLALLIAMVRVVLPYDEVHVGMTRAQLLAVNDRLLAFMAHDRVSLAGTMMAVGILYIQLSVFGIRRGLQWARMTVLTSAFSGFGSFFLFLGFGYFDPFHAFVTAILFQFLLLALHARPGSLTPWPAPANLHNDWRWRWSLWGQLLFVIQGAALFTGGLVIAWVGITSVFVPEDLEFMRTTSEALITANPRLLPLVAHDRATFGGMLVACGLGVLLPALWGYCQGSGWLWWTFLLAGACGYAAAIGVHLAVGYTNHWHLAPAFTGLVFFVIGLALSYPYLCYRGARQC